MKRTLILVFLLIMFFTTAFALPPGVMVREWSSHIVAGEVVPPEETRTTEEESEPLKPHKPEIVEELKPVDTAEQLESLESSEGKELVDSFDPTESTPIVDGRNAAGRKGEQ